MIKNFHGFVMFSLSIFKIGWILFSKAKVKETLQDDGQIINQNKSNQSLMAVLLIVVWLPELTSHFHVDNLRKWKIKFKYWIKKVINCCFSKNIRKHMLIDYLMYLCYFFSYLYKYFNRYWANQLNIFINTSTKTAIFIATHLKKHMAYHY